MWMPNFFLMLIFWANPGVYQQFVNAGAPCMCYFAWNVPDTPQPPCFYDPSNTNVFIPFKPE